MNIARDYANNVDLKLAGWNVIRIWECEIKTKAKRESTLQRLYERIACSQIIGQYQSDEYDENSIAAEPHMLYGKEG